MYQNSVKLYHNSCEVVPQKVAWLWHNSCGVVCNYNLMWKVGATEIILVVVTSYICVAHKMCQNNVWCNRLQCGHLASSKTPI